MDQVNLPKHVIDEKLAWMRAHRNNIRRYRRLLQTNLSEVERQYVNRRLAEERASLENLTDATFPIVFNMPGTKPDTSLKREKSGAVLTGGGAF